MTSRPVEAGASERESFGRQLLANGILLDTGVRGVFGRGVAFEAAVRGLERILESICRTDGAERIFFPPLTPREALRRAGFMENFPNLCGSVHAFEGDDREHPQLLDRVAAGEDWTPFLRQTEVVLTPAACYPLYPSLRGGELPARGRLFDFTACCFRREPSEDPARMQTFQVHENVRLGSPDAVRTWRQGWLERAPGLLESLGLAAKLELAHDPFFGRGGRLLRANQLEQELKFELQVPIWSDAPPTAVASFNYHIDHFTKAFDIRLPDGEAHSACLGFGLDRIALALFRRHGLDVARWPEGVRRRLDA